MIEPVLQCRFHNRRLHAKRNLRSSSDFLQKETNCHFISPLTFFVLQNVGGKATLVAHVGGVFAVFLLDDVLQVVVDLSTDTHGLLEVACSNWEDHELLHGQLVASVGASIDDVEGLAKIRMDLLSIKCDKLSPKKTG